MREASTLSGYLLARLHSLGVRHVFGIPGDYILPFFQTLVASEVRHIATCNELNAGYAADGYARLRGLGAVAVTYGPGALSLVNAVAGAYAERVPLVVISGGPPLDAYRHEPLMHHMLPGRFDAVRRIFAPITAHAVLLDDAVQAPRQIDETLAACFAQKRPVYIEFPRDLQSAACAPPAPAHFATDIASDAYSVQRAATRIGERLEQSRRTVILPGHEIQHCGLEDKVLALLERTGLPAGSLFTGKPDYLEHLPASLGAYQGAGSLAPVRAYVEEADTVIFLGAVASDFNLGGGATRLRPGSAVHVFDNRVLIADEILAPVSVTALVDALLAMPLPCRPDETAPRQQFAHRADVPYNAQPDCRLTNRRFYDRLAHFLQPHDIVLADAGCAINLTQLQLPRDTRYIAACFWASIGMGFGAALGAGCAARPHQRVIAVEGDGSFQMTAQELSSMVRYGHETIVFVVNNRGYTAERLIHDGVFNDIADWKYHRLPEAFGGVPGLEARTEDELEEALARAAAHCGPGPLLIEVHLDPFDASEAFRLMSAALRGA